MTLQRLARTAVAVLFGVTALLSSSAVAHADPEDATPPIIDDLFILTLPGTQNPGTLNPNTKGAQRDWSGSGMYCQNRNVKCRMNGF